MPGLIASSMSPRLRRPRPADPAHARRAPAAARSRRTPSAAATGWRGPGRAGWTAAWCRRGTSRPRRAGRRSARRRPRGAAVVVDHPQAVGQGADQRPWTATAPSSLSSASASQARSTPRGPGAGRRRARGRPARSARTPAARSVVGDHAQARSATTVRPDVRRAAWSARAPADLVHADPAPDVGPDRAGGHSSQQGGVDLLAHLGRERVDAEPAELARGVEVGQHHADHGEVGHRHLAQRAAGQARLGSSLKPTAR